MAGRGEKTRARLIGVAAQHLVAGDGALDVTRVAADAGISVGGLYHHFASKEALLEAVVEDFYDRYGEAVMTRTFRDEGRWPARERARSHAAVRFHYGDPLSPVLLGRTARDGTVARVDAAHLARIGRVSARNLRRAVKDGELPRDLDCEPAGAMLMGGTQLLLATAVATTPRPDEDQLAETLWTFVARIVGIDPESAAEG